MAFLSPILHRVRQPVLRHVANTPKRQRSNRCIASGSVAALESLNNPRIKAARGLLRRRNREAESKVLLEGHRLVLDALNAGLVLESVYYTESALTRGSRASALSSALAQCNPTLVSDKVMSSLSDVVTPPGVVAVISRPTRPLPRNASLVLVCDGVQDPGNIGTLVRAAAGAGAEGVLLTTGCADAWGLKALRAGMGAQLRIPVLPNLDWDEAERLLVDRSMDIRVADGGGREPYAGVDWTVPAALVVGSEANGPSLAALKAANVKVAVPMANGVESLNAAVAGAVILFEASRQRGLSLT